MKLAFSLLVVLCILASCDRTGKLSRKDFVITEGQMPDLALDNKGQLHVVYGMGDSIMYTRSLDKGRSFARPVLVATLPGLFSYAMRGPQIASNDLGIMIMAGTSQGNMFSYYLDNGSWKQGSRINDEDSVAKEGLMAISADQQNAFAAWLDLRGTQKNKIYGARSTDGGKSWSENEMIYISPDSSVCECCKPSVLVKGNDVYVMFRNCLDGNRDLYLSKSSDGGNSFDKPDKLGTGSWKLDGCPMAGGSMAINNAGNIQTVWKRKSNIYSDVPGNTEVEIGEGRDCTVETVNDKNIYAWVRDTKIVFMNSKGEEKILGEGSGPVLQTIDDRHVICVWENDKHIHAAVENL